MYDLNRLKNLNDNAVTEEALRLVRYIAESETLLGIVHDEAWFQNATLNDLSDRAAELRRVRANNASQVEDWQQKTPLTLGEYREAQRLINNRKLYLEK